MRDDARSSHPQQERIDRRRQIRKRGKTIRSGSDGESIQPIVGGDEKGPPVDRGEDGARRTPASGRSSGPRILRVRGNGLARVSCIGGNPPFSVRSVC